MHAPQPVAVRAACVALASCATTQPVPTAPPRGKTRELSLRTDPAVASRSILRDGAVVASIEATPAIAIVPRRNAPIDVVCHREGYLEMRAGSVGGMATAAGVMTTGLRAQTRIVAP